MGVRGHAYAFVTGSIIAGAGALFIMPASAASPATATFLANLVPNVDFLDRSSRLALDNSKSARLKAFALSEAREQTLAANSIDEWKDGDRVPALSAQNLDATPTGSTPATPAQGGADARIAADDRLPVGQEDLDRLEGLEGHEFDALYTEKQRDALGQVASDYQTYIHDGDVEALKSLAVRELPKIRRRLAQLGKL